VSASQVCYNACVMKLEEITQKIRAHKNRLREEFGVKSIGIFGSHVRGDATPDSDVDILVEFEEDFETFDNYMDLKFFLEDLLGKKVDLVMRDSVKEQLKERILSEVREE